MMIGGIPNDLGYLWFLFSELYIEQNKELRVDQADLKKWDQEEA